MTGKTHAAVGVNVLWLIGLTDLKLTPWILGATFVATLLPDLDASESTIKHLDVSLGTGKGRIRVKPFYPLALLFSTLFRHRGWLHSLVAVLVVAGVSSWAFWSFDPGLPIFLTLGYLSHLVLDALTPSGVQFFLPFKQKLRLLPRPLALRTGGMIDTLLFLLGTLGLVACTATALRG